MSTELDNPAERLHKILTKMLQSHSHEDLSIGTSSTPPATVRDVLKGVLKLNDKAADIEVFRALIELHKLTDEVEISMLAIGAIDEDLYREPLERIRESLTTFHLGARWREEKRKIDKGDLRALVFCSRALSNNQFHVSEAIRQEDLDNLAGEVQRLYKKFYASNLSKDVKAIILEQLEIIRRAIHDYNFRGVSSLREALERNIGALVLNKHFFEGLDQPSKEEISDFKEFLSKFASVVAFASHATAIAERVSKYLPGLIG